MRNVSICGSKLHEIKPSPSVIQTMEIEGLAVSCGLIHTSDIEFDASDPENSQRVLIKKRAFSCNYRDKSLILKAAVHLPEHTFYTVGSDFVAEVVACGPEVSGLQVGDRVIANNCYPDSGVPNVRGGVLTNQGSKEYQIVHQVKLLKVPLDIPDSVAAAFSVGAQTGYSMVRKLDIQPGTNVLVTAAKSNTSLFVINALKQRNINLFATSTSLKFEQNLYDLGVKQLIQVDPSDRTWLTMPAFRTILREIGGFDYVIDPFFDLHLGSVMPLLKPGGKYITCGFYDQYSQYTGKTLDNQSPSLTKLLTSMMLNNIHLIGNCIGTTEDLQQAIDDCASGRFAIAIDSVFMGNQIKDFFDRTYNATNRFGKVIYSYL